MKKIPIDIKFELMDDDYSNKYFSKGKCFVCYHGENCNGSYISKKDIEKALPTIFGIPVVGEYIYDIENEIFKDIKGNYTNHEGFLEERPHPIGFVDRNAKCYWQEYGNEKKEYLVVEGIILWTGRYPETKYIFDKRFNQSMEISIEDDDSSYYDEKTDLYHIVNFSFQALTVLGTDNIRNENGSVSYIGESNVEPCFPSSHFDTYSLFENFKKQYKNMIKEFNSAVEGGNGMDKKLELLEKYSHLDSEKIDDIRKNLDKFSLEDLKNKLDEESKLQFTLSMNQINEAIGKVLESKKVIVKDWYGESYETNEFYMMDIIPDDKIVILVDNSWDNYYGVEYTMEGDMAVLDFENKKKYTRGDWRVLNEGMVDTSTDFQKIKEVYNKQLESSINKATDKAIEKTKNEFQIKDTEEYKTLESEFEKIKDKYSKVESTPDEKLQLEYNDLKKNFEKTKKELEEIQGNFGKLSIKKDEISKDFSKVVSEKEELKSKLNEYIIKEKQADLDKIFGKEEFQIIKEDKDFGKLKEKAIDMELADVEEKLFSMLGKFSAKNFAKKDDSIINFGLYKYESKEESEDIPDYEKKWGK